MTGESVRPRDLRAEGIRTVPHEARPATGPQAAVFIHGNPGTRRRLGRAAGTSGRPCRAVA